MPHDMTHIDVQVSTRLTHSVRVRQVSGMYDVPLQDEISHSWQGEIDLDWDWNIGLVVGPSGCGKSTLARSLFGDEKASAWDTRPLVDQFEATSIHDLVDAFGSVGLNSIPSWLKPYHVLSTGEKFRADIARRLIEGGNELVLVDEFTSVVDRQVAHVASHAVQKYIRKTNRQFVAVSCHDDLLEWLQPDWVLSPATMEFARRSLQRDGRGHVTRPPLDVEICRLQSSAWRMFAPYHYLTASLPKSAKCFGLWVNGTLAACVGAIWRVQSNARKNIVGISRVVTLPDWQGMGLAFVLMDTLARAYKAIDIELRTYPAHPSLILAFDRHRSWRLEKKPARSSCSSSSSSSSVGNLGGRPCAVFAWAGDAMDETEARSLLGDATWGR